MIPRKCPVGEMYEKDTDLLEIYHRSSGSVDFGKEMLEERNNSFTKEIEVELSRTPDNVEGELVLSMKEDSVVGLRRSASTDRRLNEVALFFEALDESPPSDPIGLNVTIDSEEDSEDENAIDSTELCMDERGSPCSHERSQGKTIQQHGKWLLPASRNCSAESISSEKHFMYRGIISNPPEITKRGVSRGNYAQLHRKAWLEVADKHHRYGKNLRLYYRHWESLEFPYNDFFQWLDSTGEAKFHEKPELEECPRWKLDSDTVLYITDYKVTKSYTLSVSCDQTGCGYIYDVREEKVQTGPDGWIFVLRDDVLYGAPKITSVTKHSKQRFHHSSFFGGKAVSAAGILITDETGCLQQILPHSGHYRPGEADMQRMLYFLMSNGVNLSRFHVDIQQLIHVNRKNSSGKGSGYHEEKLKKTASLCLRPGKSVMDYLTQKARFIGEGIFSQIHELHSLSPSEAFSVSKALEKVDNGGYWKARSE